MDRLDRGNSFCLKLQNNSQINGLPRSKNKMKFKINMPGKRRQKVHQKMGRDQKLVSTKGTGTRKAESRDDEKCKQKVEEVTPLMV